MLIQSIHTEVKQISLKWSSLNSHLPITCTGYWGNAGNNLGIGSGKCGEPKTSETR